MAPLAPLAAITISFETVIIGALVGLAYAILAAGLVLIYRATRVINFAHGEIGAFGAAVLAKLVLDLNWPWFIALLLVLTIGAAVGGIVELTIIRRLFEAPRLILLVATIGVAQVMFVAQALLPGVDQVARFPSGWRWATDVGTLVLLGEHVLLAIFVVVTIGALAYFLGRTSYGTAIRAAAANADAARLAGVSVRKVSTTVWVLAGVLSTATFVFVNPLIGTLVGEAAPAMGPGLLLRALAAGLVGGLVSLPLTLVGGLAVGITESVLLVNVATPGVVDALLFVAVLGLVFFRGKGLAASDEGTFSLAPKVRAVPERLRQVPWVRYMPQGTAAFGLLLAIGLPLVFTTTAQQFLFTRVLIFALIGLSIVVLTGWAGQLSLGQFAFVGLGAMLTFALHEYGIPFGIAAIYATVAGVIAALAIGGPALRIRGMSLAVVTLAFAVAARGWLLPSEVLTGGDAIVFLPRGSWGFIDLADQRTYYYLCLVVLVVALLAVGRLRRTGIGRTIVAVRDNEWRAAAFTISPTVAKLSAFALSGGLAALAGVLFAGLRVQYGAGAFGPAESLGVVAMTVIGGLGSVVGAVLGAVYVIGLPALIQDSQEVRLLTSGIGLLILLLYFPGGLLQIVSKVRDSLLSVAERRLADLPAAPAAPKPAPQPVDQAAERAAAEEAPAPAVGGDGRRAPAVDETPVPPDGVVVGAYDVVVRFGGLVALQGISLEARQGEILGLIGSNGAGKSTLMNVVSGFQRADEGRVELFGQDISSLTPHDRARLGLARVFQDARLFGDLTVREAIMIALESQEHSELVPSLLGLRPSRRAERRKRAEAAELIDFLGMGRYADTFVSSLSTGTRRIGELACLLAMNSRVLLLDEPTAGVAQRETEAFAPLLQRIQRELDCTIVLIEHDMPLVLALSHRVYCLDSGRVVAEGTPDAVKRDPAVIAAYLGTDERAILRSDAPGAKRGAAPADGPWKGLEDFTREELISRGQALGLTGLTRLRKEQLVHTLEEHMNGDDATVDLGGGTPRGEEAKRP